MLETSTKKSPQTTFLKDYLPPAFLIHEVDLVFDLFEDHTLVKSHLKVQRNPARKEKIADLFLQGDELTLLSLQLNGQPIDSTHYQVSSNQLSILQVPDQFDLEITTKIYPQKNTALSGLYKVNQVFCTQCEAEGFRRITYFLDQPDVLARYTTTITADAQRYPILLSNGNLIEQGKLAEGRHWVKWQDPFKKPSYLFALVAGDFDLLEDKFITLTQKNVNIRIYVEKGYLNQAQHAMACVKEAMRWDEQTYGREYDLSIYMLVGIGDFNMGAMENKGLNIFNTKYLLAKPETATDDDYIHILSVIGHEYFHNWSGNRVTCRDWFQLSLKEGLTIFRDQTFTEDLLSRAVMRIHEVRYLREVQFPEDASPLAHQVRPESYIEINNFYTSTVYNKGAEVLRMLRTILGKDFFRKGMDLYFSRYDGQAVTIEDYIRAMEEVSGVDLNQFSLWYKAIGTPLVTVSSDYDVTQHVYSLTFHQSGYRITEENQTKPLLIPIRMALLDEAGKEMPLQYSDAPPVSETVLLLSERSQTFKFKNIISPPIPSLNRDFSAPVNLNYDYSFADYAFLFKHDTDLFNRYEAGQRYALRVLLELVRDYQQQKTFSTVGELVNIYRYILENPIDDLFFMSELLLLPSERYIGENLAVIDVEAIHAAREFLYNLLAQELHGLFLALYQQHNSNAEYTFNMQEVGKRHIRNISLHYLMRLPQYHELGVQQFNENLLHNMTNTQAAFSAINNIDVNEIREKAIADFYTAWEKDALALDKWFAIQAATKLPIALQQVKKLMRHPAFDIKNPNKVYALVGTFAHQNHIHFHDKRGEGYAFLRETVAKLDKLNPQIAARMAKPLTTWRRYDKERQVLMQKQLELLLEDNKLSPDVYEVVSKSLVNE